MKIRPLLLASAAAAALTFSGCGEDSSTEPRLNFITMINATDADIVGHLFNKSFYTIAPKTQKDDDFEAVSEAPDVWYTTAIDTSTKIGVETIHSGDLINAYIPANCNNGSVDKNHIIHQPAPGTLSVVNITNYSLDVTADGNTETFNACAVKEFPGVGFTGEKDINVSYGAETILIPLPNPGEAYDVIVFPDFTIGLFKIKAFKG
ncbi:hypothetical protein WCX72_07860 [Sulfurimonas sp. HSL1-6]|uniref:hypothetical protein n=1 Tax=Thiomicrolovo immobilis TaxID=3131935 RepID=UPI0031FA36DA